MGDGSISLAPMICAPRLEHPSNAFELFHYSILVHISSPLSILSVRNQSIARTN
jgi:hypothetical protein